MATTLRLLLYDYDYHYPFSVDYTLLLLLLLLLLHSFGSFKRGCGSCGARPSAFNVMATD